jgi:hypothetical protein
MNAVVSANPRSEQDEAEDRERHLENAPPGNESEVEAFLAVDDLAQLRVFSISSGATRARAIGIRS